MIKKVYKEWKRRTNGTLAGSLEEDIRTLADLDFTFEEMIKELGVQELAKYIVYKSVK